ncbi:MAG: BrnT family toxin [Pseudomonadales bacterium]
MIDWRQVAGFDWDDGNERKIEEKHAVNRFEAEQVFFNQPLLVLADQKHSKNEERYHALGESNDTRLLHVTFTLRSTGTLIRVISARDMHRKERNSYEQS